MIRRPPRSTLSSSSAASDVYKRQPFVCCELLNLCLVGSYTVHWYHLVAVSSVALTLLNPTESGFLLVLRNRLSRLSRTARLPQVPRESHFITAFWFVVFTLSRCVLHTAACNGVPGLGRLRSTPPDLQQKQDSNPDTRRAGRNTTAFRFCCVRRAAPLLHHHARAAAAAADATLSLCAAAE